MASLNNTLNDNYFFAAVSIQDAFRRAVAAGLEEGLTAAVDALGHTLNNVERAAPILQRANERVALGMQDSVLRSYDQVVTARKQFDSYRVGSPGQKISDEEGTARYSGGKLRDALKSDDMFVATPQGIAFINITTLNREAAHWYRLNFGAGNASGRGAAVIPWRFGGQTLGSLSLLDPPSKAFRMPHGIWSNGEGGLKPGFYPRSSKLNILTNGIQPRRFFDAGLRRFAEDAPVIYEDVLFQFVNEAVYDGLGPLADVVPKAVAVIEAL